MRSPLTAPTLSRDTYRIEHRLHRQHELDARTRAPADVHAQAVPVRVEDPMGLEQRRDARARGAREELQERREVLRADALGGERRVAQGVRVWRGQPREVARRREGARRGRRVQCVHPAERRAEQARERVLQRFPPLVHPFFFLRYVALISFVIRGQKGGEKKKERSKRKGTLFRPRRPSMPRAPLLSQHLVRLGAPSGRNPISQSLSLGGILESHARVESGRGPRERCCSAGLERYSLSGTVEKRA